MCATCNGTSKGAVLQLPHPLLLLLLPCIPRSGHTEDVLHWLRQHGNTNWAALCWGRWFVTDWDKGAGHNCWRCVQGCSWESVCDWQQLYCRLSLVEQRGILCCLGVFSAQDLFPCAVRQLFWMYYICNWHDRSSIVIRHLDINRKVGLSFRLQEDTLVKVVKYIVLQCLC